METIAYEELLARDGQVTTHVVGTSMLPLLHNRQSIVTVESVDRVPPRRGDVVLYKVNGTYILHRVMRIQGGDYLIRGDNTWVMEHVRSISTKLVCGYSLKARLQSRFQRSRGRS